MKKLYKFSAFAAMLVSMSLASCNHEQEDFFPDSAAQRTENARQYFNDILVDQGGKWQMEYFTTDEESGYIYLFTFSKDGSVTISGNNKYITKLTNIDSNRPSFGSETSLWTILSDNGPVLSLNSYNTYFHLFSDPEDIPDTDANEKGYGHSGDYEFNLMKYSGDTLYLQGKKGGTDIIMTRVAQDVDDRTYLNEVVALADSFFNAKIPAVYVNLPGGYRHVVLDGATQLPVFYPETGDYITENVRRNAIITHDGFTLGSPLTLRDSIDGNDYTIQHFIRQADGSLLCTDDNRTTITADALNKVLSNESLLWQFGASGNTGDLGTMYADMVAGFRAYRSTTISFFRMGLNKDSRNVEYPNTLYLRLRSNQRNIDVYQYYTLELVGDDEFRIVLGEPTANFTAYYNNVPAFKALIDKLGSTTFKCTTPSLLAPTKMYIGDGNDASSKLLLNLQ